MGWDSRRYDEPDREEGGGGVRAVFRRIFGDGENPLTWAVPLYRAWGIQVKIHLIFIIMIVAELIWALPKDRMAVQFVLIAMGGLFLLVLLHEYGHCIAARKVGGTADQILMWPLGGLAYVATPHNWKADLITTVGGPAVNAILWPMFGLLLAAVLPGDRIWQATIFNPFDPWTAFGSVRLTDGTQPIWLLALWMLYYLNLLLLAFNVLLPMYPMDGGRILHALMWRKMGHHRATKLAAQIGLGIAILLFVIAITGNQSRLVGLSIFGGITCWLELSRQKMMVDPVLGSYDFDRGYQGMPDTGGEERSSRAKERRRKKEQEEQEELDRILGKIAQTGMASLSRRETRWLQRTTEKRRGR